MNDIRRTKDQLIKELGALRRKAASLEEIRTIADNVPELFSYIDRKCIYRFVNKRYEELFRVPRAQIVGRHCSEVLGETTYRLIKVYIDSALSGKAVHFEKKIPYAFGGYRWVSANYIPNIDEQGGINGFYSLISDITERVEAKESIEKSEAKFRDLYDNAPDMYHTLDENGVILECNEIEAKKLGYKKEELIGKHITDFFKAESEKLFKIDFPKLKEKRELLHLEREFIRKDGTTFPASLNVFSVYDENGKFVGARTIARDITRLKQVEDAFLQSEKKYRHLVENTLVGIYQTNLSGDLLYANEALLKMLEFESPEDMMAQGVLKTYKNPKDRDFLIKKLKKENKIDKFDVELVTKKGNTRHVILSASLDKDIISGMIMDISERRQAEEKIKIYHERLSELASKIALIAEDERRRFADELHDLTGQNLALAKIKLSELRDSLTNKEILDRLDELYQLIEEAAVSTRSLTFELSPPILYEIGFEAAAEWLGEQILGKYNISFLFDADARSKPLSDEARVLLFVSLRELIVNIAKHSKARNATVTLRREGNNLHVSVSDDGIGFDASALDFQIMRATSFGLFSTRERVERLGGRLEIASQPEKGTKVTMVVPLKE